MKRIYLSMVAAFVSAMAMAQNSDVNVNVTKAASGGGIPWLWIVGGILFILILVALLSGSRGGTDRVVEKRTIIKD